MHSEFGVKRIVKAARNTEKQLFALRFWDCSGEICGHGQKGKSVLLWTEFGLLASDFYIGIIRNSPTEAGGVQLLCSWSKGKV